MKRLNFSDARHLVSRTALGQEWHGVNALQGKPRSEAVSILLQPSQSTLPRVPTLTPWRTIESMNRKGGQGKKRARLMMQHEGERLKMWWMKHFLTTRSPVNEHMTLFWHNHFTSSLEKVEQPALLLEQNQLLRRHALGNFRAMLHAVARDPAMLVYLDGSENIKGKPNENFARELLELFTLGRGHYWEADIKAAAVAFTGWGVDRHSGQFAYDASMHDDSPVTFIGRRGAFSGDDIIDIILEQPAVAELIAEKFWREFVSDQPADQRAIRQWATVFRDSNYNIRVLLDAVLNSEQFWSGHYRGTLTKSPVDLIVGTQRALPYPQLASKELVHIAQLLGQDLFDPPTVKGWQGGTSWIDTQTLLVRTSLMNKLTRTTRADDSVRARLPDTDGQQVVDWLLPQPPVLPLPDVPGKLRLTRALILDPVFQLK